MFSALFEIFVKGSSVSELSILLSSELELTRAAYVTLVTCLSCLSFGIS